jgi:type II secretion system protein N
MMSKPKLSTISICLVLFLVFSFLLFPYQNLRGYIFGAIYKQTQILVMADELYPTFFGWPGLGMRNASVNIPMTALGIRDSGTDWELSAKKLVVRMNPMHPFSGVSLTLKELKKGGDLFMKLSQSSSEIQSDLSADEVELGQLTPPDLINAFSGILTADSSVDLNLKDPSKSTGHADIKIEKLKMGAQNVMGIIFAPTNIDNLNTKLHIRNGTVEITKFELGSPKSDISGTLAGDVRLGPTMMQDFLNLTLRLKLSDAYRQNPQAATLVSLLSSFESSPGSYAMKWSASLQEMSTNTFKANPQKATP